MTDTPLSPLGTDSSDDLLSALDEMLGFAPGTATSMDSLAQVVLDTSYVVDAFELPEVPNLYEQQPVKERKCEVPDVKAEQAVDSVPVVTKQLAQQQSAEQGKDIHMTMCSPANSKRRKRPKDELDYLRAKVADLEEELASLNRSAKRFSSVNDDDEEMFARWRLVAERQKEEANKTIVENLKLRALLKDQLEIAKRREMVIADYQQQMASQALPWNLVKTELNLDVEDADDAGRPRSPSISDEAIIAELNEKLEAHSDQVGSPPL